MERIILKIGNIFNIMFNGIFRFCIGGGALILFQYADDRLTALNQVLDISGLQVLGEGCIAIIEIITAVAGIFVLGLLNKPLFSTPVPRDEYEDKQ